MTNYISLWKTICHGNDKTQSEMNKKSKSHVI